MLKEFEGVSQHKEGHRRYFYDDFFDLFIWYNEKSQNPIGFQLCYNKNVDEHSIIWDVDNNYLHSAIDTGENNPGCAKQSPISISDGYFDKNDIGNKFFTNGKEIDQDIFDLVYNKILNY